MVTVIDLFAGCGGLSLGAARAGLSPNLAVELDDHAAAAHSKNFPHCKTAKLDLSKVDSAAINSLYSGRPDLVIGGPPCQGFSYIGKRNQSDPRNDLLDRFFQIVSDLKPRAFMMENVPGLLSKSSFQLLERALQRVPSSYVVLTPSVLDAADFGAATRRKRVLVIGYDPTDVDPISFGMINKNRRAPATVSQALEGLPEPGTTDVAEVGLVDSPYVRFINRRSVDLGDACKLNAHSDCRVSGFEATKHSPEVESRFSATPQGKTEKVSRFFRLNPNEPARTLRAGTGVDKGSFQSARPIHHVSPRVVSVREAARIQGFPDWFDFHPTKWHSHRMIGNSVNPLFAEAILTSIARSLGVPG
ncbi:DNA cytosine methyltransferase [Octadecabacter sp. 1_MG-2023]|uniref:DNA cytosine methyltransferase n=1 Tax=unclassified Octadecabacter TaxID=196158 RepID=UPI001C09A414|nr:MULTISPECIES: DNA cytosine methyltransferase [unclassified Octadecabacter]MBU2993947.1 DNA cytosine methyltransferase [Octadecabacter sp. B2R22]MDO6735207.1 DNA cytosine methyltransferase [Octadecabacter sp. 1_MG-2023]